MAPDAILFHYVENPGTMAALAAAAPSGPWGFLRQLVQQLGCDLAPSAPLPTAGALRACRQEQRINDADKQARSTTLLTASSSSRDVERRPQQQQAAAPFSLEHFNRSRYRHCGQICERGGCAGFSHPARECGGCPPNDENVGCFPEAPDFQVVEDKEDDDDAFVHSANYVPQMLPPLSASGVRCNPHCKPVNNSSTRYNKSAYCISAGIIY